LATTSIRVLVVDDSESFRRVVCSILQNKLEFRTIVEATDGVEAIELAQTLQPDLILLDIGLPKLNGIEVARRIRGLAPQSKILVISQESSVDVVQAAFSLGASGYVVKMDVGRELLTAVDAVLRGERFVGSRFAGHGFTGGSDAGASERLRGNSVVAPFQQSMEVARCHEAGFYSDDRYLLDDLTEFIGAALMVGNAAVVVATESHRDSLLPRLKAHGVDIDVAIEQGRYIALDASDTLSTFMLNGMPDSVLFLKLLGDLIGTAAKPGGKGEQTRVAIFGEMCHLLWAPGNAEAAIQVERLGNQLAQRYAVDILCGYAVGKVQGRMESHIFQRICAEHSNVYSR
jgi:DNA-binding NarL/FixJ family response regulator